MWEDLLVLEEPFGIPILRPGYREFRSSVGGAHLQLVGRPKAIFDRMNGMDRIGYAANADG